MLKKDGRLKAFHAVVVHGSFTQAAEALLLTQQAVSFQIKMLEDELGTRLLLRHSKTVELTETGELLFRYARQIIELYSEAEDAIAQHSGTLGGSLHIGATGSIANYCLPAAIGEFRKICGNVSVSILIANSEGVADLLAREVIDLGIISGGPVALDKFVVEPFFEDDLVFVSSPHHSFARRRELPILELVRAAFVVREPGSGTRKLMDSYFSDRGFDPTQLDIAATVGSTEAVKASVASDAGIAMVSRLSLGENRTQSLSILDVESGPLNRSFYFVRPRETYMRRVLDMFIRTLRAQNSARPSVEPRLKVV